VAGVASPAMYTKPLTTPSSASSTPASPIRLVVTDGPDRGKEAKTGSAATIIGSSAECDLVLKDETVSRRHTSIEVLGRYVRVRDLGSRNGTRYLGARVDAAEIPVGSTVEIGRNRVALLPLTPAVAVMNDKTELQGLVGRSPAMRRVFAEIEQLAPTDVPVLIRGESGTGKELVARAIHALSLRAEAPLRVFDCSAVNEDLIHSALFGHVKGAFTGADQDRPGALEEAHLGTLFLDEVGELPFEVQPTLLRALETHQFSRVGEDRVRRADFRLICATHRNLEAEVSSGKFRLDLYHRLPAVTLTLPPLRERREDVAFLAEHFAKGMAPAFRFSSAEVAVLNAHLWPGNVRELRNSVQRMISVRGSSGTASATPGSGEATDFHSVRERVLQTFEKAYLEDLLARHHGNGAPAARESGLAKSYFYKLLALHGLTPKRGGARES
jgi:DNA-binding NtrC family response regulator